MSIGLCYNAEIRNNGTPVLVWDAIKNPRGHSWGLGFDCERYSRPASNIKEHSLYIQMDDGRDDIEWTPPHPNAFWAVDTHLGYDRRLEWAKKFDYVFTAQKEGAERMRKDGIKRAHWLPLACHPPAHPDIREMMVHPDKDSHCGDSGLDKQHDLVFVGFMQDPPAGEGYNNRLDYLDYLWKKFPNSWLSVACFWEPMAVRYIRGRLGFNISIRDDLNMRFFEILSTGTAELSNSGQVGYEELGFKDEEHFISYDDMKYAVDKTEWFLKNHEERESIAKRGHDLVRSKHTYMDRVIQMLDICEYDGT